MKLLWTTQDGIETASENGIKYEIRNDGGQDACPWELWITWNLDKPDDQNENDIFIPEAPTAEICKAVAESHAQAVRDAIANSPEAKGMRDALEAIAKDQPLEPPEREATYNYDDHFHDGCLAEGYRLGLIASIALTAFDAATKREEGK